MANFMVLNGNVPPQVKMQWHVTGENPDLPALRQNVKPNWMRRFVEWIENPQTPSYFKVIAVAASVIGILALGVALNHRFLSLLVVGGLAIWFRVEQVKIEKAIDDEIEKIAKQERTRIAQENAFKNMQAVVGGEEAWNNLPVLNIGDRMGPTGYIDFIGPEEMGHSVMRGVDSFGRPFVCMKIRSLRPEDGGEPFVITFFQRYVRGGLWVYGVSDPDIDRVLNANQLPQPLDPQAREIIRRIVVDRNHPGLALI